MAYLQNGYLYQVRVYDTNHVLIGIYNDLLSLYYTSIVNSPGMAIATVQADHALVPQLTDDMILEVWISYPGTDALPTNWVVDFTGIYRDKQIATDGNGNYYYVLYFPGSIEILARSIVAYPAGIELRSQFTGYTAKDIMNQIVFRNCTSAATVAGSGRIRSFNPVNGLVIMQKGSPTFPATTYNYRCAYRNVLECLQELSELSSIDFEIYLLQPISWFGFTLHPNQLGADRTADVIFDLNLDNTKSGSLTGDRLREKTIAIVGGQGEGTARSTVVRTGANYGVTNDYELFVDARGNIASELDAAGDARLEPLVATASMEVNISPSLGYVYRQHYTLGDLVTARFGGLSQTKKIHTIEVKFNQDQQVEVKLGLKNV